MQDEQTISWKNKNVCFGIPEAFLTQILTQNKSLSRIAFNFLLHSRSLTAKAPEKWCLEDDPASFWVLTVTFQGFSLAVKLQVGRVLQLNGASKVYLVKQDKRFQPVKVRRIGGLNPFEKYWSNWIISPSRGKNKKCLKPPPRRANSKMCVSWNLGGNSSKSSMLPEIICWDFKVTPALNRSFPSTS